MSIWNDMTERGESDEAQIARLSAERDAARLELRALEWLVHNVKGASLMHLMRTTPYGSYAAAARALGWEG